MKLREVRVKNFRSLADITVPLDDTTILLGQNNSGKTAFLEAIRFVLSRSTGKKSPFDGYDYYMENPTDSPETSDGIEIVLWFREDKLEEWPESLIQAISDFAQLDPISGLNSVGLKLTCKYDSNLDMMVPTIEFIASDGQPLTGKTSSFSNISMFLSYVRIFYLSALRDYENEFSSRSQFWGKIIKDLKISPEQQDTFREELERINQELLRADPRMEQVRESLENVQNVLGLLIEHTASIQALPLKPWELLTKSTVVMKNKRNIEFPLGRYGQGMQSMAVIFLFQAYINVLLKPTFEEETEAILALEEPEAHLHPHAIRALSRNIASINSQKIITTHSPAFIEEIPLHQIRIFRLEGSSTKVLYIKKCYETTIPETPELITYCDNHGDKFEYNKTKSQLIVRGSISEDEYRDLLISLASKKESHQDLKRLKEQSTKYLSDDEIIEIETYSKRIRGEIYFARAWFLCEGQSEYLLIRYFADLMGKSLDQAGISIIDFQNNGSPGAFVSLAKNFEVPWIMITDGDDAGKDFRKRLTNKGITEEELNEQFFSLSPQGTDLELFLVISGFREDYLNILSESAKKSSAPCSFAR